MKVDEVKCKGGGRETVALVSCYGWSSLYGERKYEVCMLQLPFFQNENKMDG